MTMSTAENQVHNIEPVYDNNSKILILGSFPSVRSREMGFFYGHPQNRFWRVLSCLLGVDVPESIDAKKQMLLEHGIALWDVIASCDIAGSDDSSITNVIANDIKSLLDKSHIKVIYCNGNKAKELYDRYIFPEIGIKAIRLPSTSPANAAFSYDELCSSYARILTALKRTDYGTKYYSLNSYAHDFYGKKLYRLALDGGFTCPNRDGKLDTRGCIFCDGGSGDFAGKSGDSIAAQLETERRLISEKLPKTKSCGYIAYFQSFTGTYDEVTSLEELYMQAVADPEVDIVSIATRPDCLGRDVLELLGRINKIKPVWIELGLQTIHKNTAEYIRRGYELKVYDKAIRNLHRAGIRHIITHVILGLPGEDKKMMLETAQYVGMSGGEGIKLQLLHVLKGTDLAEDFCNDKFKVLEREEYYEIIRDILEELPADMVVHRLTGDGNKARLIAPLWSGDKKRVLNDLNRILR